MLEFKSITHGDSDETSPGIETLHKYVSRPMHRVVYKVISDYFYHNRLTPILQHEIHNPNILVVYEC